MTLDSLTARVRRLLRSGNDTGPYQTVDLHDAILEIGNDFVNETACVVSRDLLTLEEDQEVVDFSDIDGFEDRLRIDSISAVVSLDATVTAALTADAVSTSFTISNGGTGYDTAPTITFSGGGGTGATATATVTDGVITAITRTAAGSGYTSAPTVVITRDTGDDDTAYELDQVDLGSLREYRRCNTGSGTPTHIAFRSRTDAEITPPDFDGGLEVIWFAPFLAFEPGDTNDPTINLPDRFLIQMVRRMAVQVQLNKNETPVNSALVIQEYERFRDQCKGTNGLEAKSIIRSKAW